MKELLKKYSEIIRYLIIGVLTTMVSLGVYYILTLTIFDPKKAIELQITNIISWIASVTFAYFTNRSFVFQQTQKMSLKEAVNFYNLVGFLSGYYDEKLSISFVYLGYLL